MIKKSIIFFMILAGFGLLLRFFLINPTVGFLSKSRDFESAEKQILTDLKNREDKTAFNRAQRILRTDPENNFAIWAKAEVLRRRYDFKESQELLEQVLAKDPDHTLSQISLAYIYYNDSKLDEATRLLKQCLGQKDLSSQNRAMVYILIGSINAKRINSSAMIDKLFFAVNIKKYFIQALEISPELPEVHLGLGTYFLLAPQIMGGNVDKSIEHLEIAIKLSPQFSTPYMRLSQAYKKKGDMEKAEFYRQKAVKIEPGIDKLKNLQ
ncbi:MAG: hypothetical protein C4533_02750 [Candidatus Omnitrophota bacterium]|jgi:tetratricopeptide (TPR) repeat protein|nr:MAG: hypothetical protein C4533_02750 [Candidatus Omnitrophota bacterium]